MNTGKEQSKELFDSAIGFAEQMLQQHGAFIPYAEAIKPNGEFVSIGADLGEEYPKSKDVLELFEGRLSEASDKNEYIATAIVYDVRVSIPNTDKISDAIAVALDHKNGYSVIVCKPYSIIDKNLVFGDLFVNTGKHFIFKNDL